MQSLLSYLDPESLEKLASSSHFRYGVNMMKDGEVTLGEYNRFNLAAEVGKEKAQKRNVELHATPKGLKWKCTCSNRKNFFCNHCVAAGLAFYQSQQKPTQEVD